MSDHDIAISLPADPSDDERAKLIELAMECDPRDLSEDSPLHATLGDFRRELRAAATGTSAQVQRVRHALLYEPGGGLDLFGNLGADERLGARLLDAYADALDGEPHDPEEVDRLANEVRDALDHFWRWIEEADVLLAEHSGRHLHLRLIAPRVSAL